MTGILTYYSTRIAVNNNLFSAEQENIRFNSDHTYQEGDVVLFYNGETGNWRYGVILAMPHGGENGLASRITFSVRPLNNPASGAIDVVGTEMLMPAGSVIGNEHRPEVFAKEVIGTAVFYMKLAANLLDMGRNVESEGKGTAEGPIGEVADDYRPNLLSIIEDVEESILPEFKVIAGFRETVRARNEEEAKEKVRAMIAGYCSEEGGRLEHQADVDVE